MVRVGRGERDGVILEDSLGTEFGSGDGDGYLFISGLFMRYRYEPVWGNYQGTKGETYPCSGMSRCADDISIGKLGVSDLVSESQDVEEVMGNTEDRSVGEVELLLP